MDEIRRIIDELIVIKNKIHCDADVVHSSLTMAIETLMEIPVQDNDGNKY